MRYRIFVFVLASVFLPVIAQAGPFDSPIIPEVCSCAGRAPAYGCVLQVIQNVIRVAIGLGFVMATLALVYAGFVWMTSLGNAEKRSQGKNMLLNVIVGLAIMLGAWLIIDFVMKSVAGNETGGFGPWNNILAGNNESGERCLQPQETQSVATGSVSVEAVPSGGGGGASSGGVSDPITGTRGCPTCVQLDGFRCTNNCTVDPALRDRLMTLVRSFEGTWVVTEAYPPTARHTNQCHYSGTCIDAAFRSPTTYTAQNISAFASAVSRSGLRAVFETESCSLRDAARQAGVTAYCRSDNGYAHITGNHFSVYSR